MSIERKAYHHGDLPRAVVEAAVRILAEDGLHGLTFQALGRATGVSHAAVRKHFADKNAVMDAVAQAGFALLDRVIGEAIASAPRDPRRAFLHVGRAPVEFAVAHPVYFRAMFAEPAAVSLRKLAQAPPDTPFGRLLELISDWQRAGLLRKGPRFSLAISLWATTHGLAALAESGHLPRDPDARRRIVDRVHTQLLEGLGRS